MTKKYGIVYIITNLINNKKYIGQTTQSLQHRWWTHYYYRLCPCLGKAIKKYGKKHFQIREFCTCFNKHELDRQEIRLIQKFNTSSPNGYNLSSGGAYGKHAEESKKKISRAKKGKPGRKHSEEFKEYLRQINTGKIMSKEARHKVSQAQRGRKRSEAAKRHLSRINKGKKHSEQTKQKMHESQIKRWQIRKQQLTLK